MSQQQSYEEIRSRLLFLIKERLEISLIEEIPNLDQQNIFDLRINLSAIEAVCLLKEVESEWGIDLLPQKHIDKRFTTFEGIIEMISECLIQKQTAEQSLVNSVESL